MLIHKNRAETLSAAYTFDKEEELADWLVEGEGKAYIENGKLILEPLYFPLMEILMKTGVISEDESHERVLPVSLHSYES